MQEASIPTKHPTSPQRLLSPSHCCSADHRSSPPGSTSSRPNTIPPQHHPIPSRSNSHAEDEPRPVQAVGLRHRPQRAHGGVDEREALERGRGGVEGHGGEGVHHHLEDDRRAALLPALRALVVDAEAPVGWLINAEARSGVAIGSVRRTAIDTAAAAAAHVIDPKRQAGRRPARTGRRGGGRSGRSRAVCEEKGDAG